MFCFWRWMNFNSLSKFFLFSHSLGKTCSEILLFSHSLGKTCSETHWVRWWSFISSMHSWDQRVSCLLVERLCVLSMMSILLECVNFFWSTTVAITPPLNIFINLSKGSMSFVMMFMVMMVFFSHTFFLNLSNSETHRMASSACIIIIQTWSSWLSLVCPIILFIMSFNHFLSVMWNFIRVLFAPFCLFLKFFYHITKFLFAQTTVSLFWLGCLKWLDHGIFRVLAHYCRF